MKNVDPNKAFYNILANQAIIMGALAALIESEDIRKLLLDRAKTTSDTIQTVID